ncbi:alpha/beta fold hydrolase [Paenibacillus hexagrammi]|uniref:Alpha/beta hydrolase n=1 Tax=Paenibacillus hexagrammi TaxID=2908839 RepID=A0ABY3SPM5_9BACL|nr:alpha/beta hydrolase [Paenibacillus sp. YPD9-1]UJF35924.1 alpha/beta hydrolase [Paenibacillus sp. YPD9-1]
MERRHGYWKDSKNTDVYLYAWLPDEGAEWKGILQIAHGMSESALRYERLAAFLTSHGYAVYANDHIGHGLTAGSPEQIGIFVKDSFHHMARHLGEIAHYIREQHDHKLPLYLMGHSMGSFLVQYMLGTYLAEHPRNVQGVVLSGSNGSQGPALLGGIVIAALEARIKGENHRSKLLHGLTFGAYNKGVSNARTSSDWLSRDAAEVAAYEADPYCGAICSSGFYRDFFRGLRETHSPALLRNIRKDLPIYIFAGDGDPVGAYGKGIQRLYTMYQNLGVKHVSCKLYPEGRHEMLNEINRDEVMQDLLEWLDSQRG